METIPLDYCNEQLLFEQVRKTSSIDWTRYIIPGLVILGIVGLGIWVLHQKVFIPYDREPEKE